MSSWSSVFSDGRESSVVTKMFLVHHQGSHKNMGQIQQQVPLRTQSSWKQLHSELVTIRMNFCCFRILVRTPQVLPQVGSAHLHLGHVQV